MPSDRPAAATWFQRVTWLGIAANLALAIPTLVATERMIALAGFPPVQPLLWTRFAAWLLILLSAFYVPAAMDCLRYATVAWLAVGARLAGVVFFATQPREYLTLGLFDFVFLVPEAILLWRAVRSAPAPVDRTATRRFA